jgi:hypothetical protein
VLPYTAAFPASIARDQVGRRIEPGTGFRRGTKPRDSRHQHSASKINGLLPVRYQTGTGVSLPVPAISLNFYVQTIG